MKDGVDSVSAGIRELKSAGYVIRARRRGEAGRFLKAEEATWITLDDPAMHDSVADELRAEGFAILSEFVRKDRAPKARDSAEEGCGAEKAQVVPRTEKSVSGPATSGKATSGKPRSGEPGAINYSWDKAPESNQPPLSSSPREAGAEGEGDGCGPYRRGEFPEEFERLCAMSIKPVASLKFKRSCLAAWEKRVAEGYLPTQIADAYAAYAESYRGRNGEDGRLAKNLARWLEGDDGMPVWSDDPIPPDALGCDGEPLDMEGLAKADPGFAKLWRRVASRRNVILSLLYDRNPGASREDFEAECEADETLARHMAACEERYGRYLALRDSMEGGAAAGRRVAS